MSVISRIAIHLALDPKVLKVLKVPKALKNPKDLRPKADLPQKTA